MNKLTVTMDNCYGISRMNHEFDFSNSNVITIYARNGLMKTSFTKTFCKISENKADEVRDEIFDIDGAVKVEYDGKPIESEKVFIIKSFESSYEANVTPLLINSKIKELLVNVLESRDKLFKALEKYSGLKIKKVSAGKTLYELETQVIKDFGFVENSFLLNALKLCDMRPDKKFENISYSALFDDSVLRKIDSKEFQEKIVEFVKRSEEIYDSYGFLQKGKLTLPKLKDIRKSLEKGKFFVKGNGIVLSGAEKMTDIQSLNEKIEEIDKQLKAVPQFQFIEKMLSDAKGTVLKDIIETTPELIEFLASKKLPELRKNLWLSYLQDNNELLSDLCKKYKELSKEIDEVSLDDTPWKNALEIFKKRFDVPYQMEIKNLRGAVIGESIPRVEFSFEKAGRKVTLSRSRLDEIDILSQGEKRALYLLNIIFEIEEIKQNGEEVLFIIDDIADSFDYKNKYAIIEYLYELAGNKDFNMIILSHNFDFYRTVSSRLGLPRDCRLFADNTNEEITLIPEYYQNQPFIKWKEHLTKKNVIALVPFVRNLVEYGRDYKVNGSMTDYLFLTSLLHKKAETHNRRFSELLDIYKVYLGIDEFQESVVLADSIIECLYSICDRLTASDTQLEDKILLAMAIRHKAEEFMIKEIEFCPTLLTWRENRKKQHEDSGVKFLEYALNKSNQTRELLNGYRQFGDASKIKIIEEVNIMTPENIHLNSFMYEPLLDMDIVELLSLYQDVKTL